MTPLATQPRHMPRAFRVVRKSLRALPSWHASAPLWALSVRARAGDRVVAPEQEKDQVSKHYLLVPLGLKRQAQRLVRARDRET